MAVYNLNDFSVSLTNIVPNGNFEEDSGWGGNSYNTSNHHSGNRCNYFPSGTTQVGSISTPTMPIVGHKYYGRHWLFCEGNNQPADCRFEWYAGDGPGLNFVFGLNRGNYPSWGFESSVITVDQVNASSYTVRNFVVNSTAEMFVDDLLIVDLTEAFGSGQEPSKDWCDKNIPDFVGTISISKTISQLKKGDIINCPYSGSAKSIALPKGTFQFECWGAQGGYRSSSTYGGKGGYAKGTLSLLDKTTSLFLYSGGSGKTGGVNGGFNGGGIRYSYAGGGGGSDIRVGTDSLYARVIVAGGGGSDGATNRAGGVGGGSQGKMPATTSFGTNYSKQGLENGVSGGTSYLATNPWTTLNPTTAQSTYSGFGFGGAGPYRSSGYGGAGGGGWYGGGGNHPDGSSDDDAGGAGGSGYVYTSGSAANYPSGCLLNSSYYLSDTQLLSGDESMPDPLTGSSVTGREGDGYIRITVIDIQSLNLRPKINGTWKDSSDSFAKVNGSWKHVSSAYTKVNGVWKPVS